MATWTDAEEARIELIEKVLNNLQTVANSLLTKQQFRQLLLVRQSEIDALTARVTALEAQITVLQNTIE